MDRSRSIKCWMSRSFASSSINLWISAFVICPFWISSILFAASGCSGTNELIDEFIRFRIRSISWESRVSSNVFCSSSAMSQPILAATSTRLSCSHFAHPSLEKLTRWTVDDSKSHSSEWSIISVLWSKIKPRETSASRINSILFVTEGPVFLSPRSVRIITRCFSEIKSRTLQMPSWRVSLLVENWKIVSTSFIVRLSYFKGEPHVSRIR